jgi:outer membrane immunogenic protein
VCPSGNSISRGQGYSLGSGIWESLAVRSERFITEDLKMKKLAIALTTVAAFTAPALAADMAAKAPMYQPPAPVYSWTGFYIFGGGGGGLWNADSNVVAFPAGVAFTRDQRLGGSGWFGTVGAGYDWQFGSWVAGVFGDGQFGEIRGSLSDPFNGIEGREKLRDTWAAGVRLGYLVAPNVYSYFNAGYTGSEWSGVTLTSLVGGPTVATTTSFHRDGWFVGGGFENSLNFFGITAPGWFMKTEYRSAFFDRITLPETFVVPGVAPSSVTFKPWVQTISTSLVYRFNWGAARY